MITLAEIAEQAMSARGFITQFSKSALKEVNTIQPLNVASLTQLVDLRSKLWVSIDNDDSLDLDQLTYAEDNRIFVAVADVQSLVKAHSELDQIAAHNTTSVYTPTKVFPMLPPKLSNDLTSLNPNVDRTAFVIEMEVDSEGNFTLINITRAVVYNHAKLTYNGVAAWLTKKESLESKHPIPGLDEQIKLQDRLSQRIKEQRYRKGALSFGVPEIQPVIVNNQPVSLEESLHNRAHKIIENIMIATNVCMTRYLTEAKIPVIRRIVRTPKKWDRIVSLAKEYGTVLPNEPNAKALRTFLLEQKQKQPETYQDLSLAVIKLIGRGEYVVGLVGDRSLGHFDLAEQDYAHTTAPNRRYPDLIMQRLLQSFLTDKAIPYRDEELVDIAANCTQKEDDAAKVERRVRKSAAAIILEPLLGQEFPAIVTGASEKGTWVRLLQPPVEGKLVKGSQGLEVGNKVSVRLVHVDVANGYIDFARVR